MEKKKVKKWKIKVSCQSNSGWENDEREYKEGKERDRQKDRQKHRKAETERLYEKITQSFLPNPAIKLQRGNTAGSV